MSFEEFSKNLDKLNKNFELTTSSYSLSKKDIKQDDIVNPKDITSKNDKNDISNYNLNSFTEIEDEKGNIILVKYSSVEYEYRGNKYCQYILINEETKYIEHGIAQIKGGQKIHIKDPKRVNTIKSYIKSEKHNAIEWCEEQKVIYKNDNYEAAVFFIGFIIYYAEGSSYFDKGIYAFYQSEDENDVFYGKTIYYNSYIDSFFNNKTDTFNKSRILKFIDDEAFHKVNEIKSFESKNSKKEKLYEKVSRKRTGTNKKALRRIIKFLNIGLYIIMLYPVTELLLWTCAHIVPLLTDKMTLTSVSDFAVKYLPYAYHPDCKWYSHFATNIIYVSMAWYIICEIKQYYDSSIISSKEYLIPIAGFLFGLIFLLAIFIPEIYNPIAKYSLWLVIGGFLVYKLRH